ncbi:phage holin family protein [Nereida sp. MMG025]|uniref:phage holin family protein n=1 Tax=Nereida sp. MMG025 TaxID=2909981 RepID=UPI001F25F635|nr:phage holin family protein [Nereida sp. MMG025]MCF6445870.1 phage holin family protein [Nereida sp. MMG025]
MAQHDLRNAPTLLVETLRAFSSLFQNELALAKAELKASVSRAGTGLALIVVAILMALVALNVLASALVAWIAAAGLSIGLSALIVGGALLVIAAVFVLIGKSRLSPENLHPTRTTQNVARDLETLTEATHG